MLKHSIIAVALAACSVPALAQVVVQAPEEIVVVAIDDQEIRGGLFRGEKNIYQLDAGQHSISVKYQQIFYHLSGEHDVLKSNIVTLNQVDLKDGEKYQLALLNPPQDFEAGKQFAKQPTVALKNQSGQIVAQQTGANSEAKPWFSKGIFTNVFDLRQDETAAQAATTTSQAVQPEATTTAVAATTTVVESSAPVAQAARSKDQLLIELWKKASPQERQKFTAWLAEQAAQ